MKLKNEKNIQDNKLTIFTIGHSTKSLDDFLEILKHYNINEVIDIRTIPKSGYNPQFNKTDLAKFLRNHHIGYRHQKNLGGLRHPQPNSPNTAWINKSFQGFADYMQTKDFENGIKKLIKTAYKKNVVIMCAEALPWRCHRSLIADALLAQGLNVIDIFNLNVNKIHKLTAWAVINEKKVTYPKS